MSFATDTDTLIKYIIDNKSVENQYKIAVALAANCGYQLIAEDTERSLEIKELIAYYKGSKSKHWKTVTEGLESLLAKR